MESFDEWVGTSNEPCIQKWAHELMKLGASWGSFQRDSTEVMEDLVRCDIPLLAARDIVRVVSAALLRSQNPLAIFWDVENIPIPMMTSGCDVVARLKSALAPHGKLDQFYAYSNMGLELIPPQKRSELQLLGCHLVDCSHMGQKGIADKMIIVDAMEFAYKHVGGATLCFITGNVGLAYLLSKLKKQSQWKTIVVSKATTEAMLHESCDIIMHWETDVLGLKETTWSDESLTSQADRTGETSSLQNENIKAGAVAEIGQGQNRTLQLPENCEEAYSTFEQIAAPDEKDWEENVELLRTIINSGPSKEGQHQVLKAVVGTKLKKMNPSRFPNRDAIQPFLAKAIEEGIVVEIGKKVKSLRLPTENETRIEFEDLSAAEQWTKYKELLWPILRDAPKIDDQQLVLKSHVGLELQHHYSSVIHNRRLFLSQAIEMGVIVEISEGQRKALRLPNYEEESDLSSALEALTAAEEWTDDARLLQSVLSDAFDPLRHAQRRKDGHHQASKAYVGSTLRQRNPTRIPDSETLEEFLANALETGVVVEIDDFGEKSLQLPEESEEGDNSGGHPTFTLTEKSPVDASEIPQKALRISESLPFMLFVPWRNCPKGSKFPPKTFVQSSGKWAILMFKKPTDAQRVVSDAPWLQDEKYLVDWSKIESVQQPTTTDSTWIEQKQRPNITDSTWIEQKSNKTAPSDEVLCAECKKLFESTKMFTGDSDELYCMSCFRISPSWGEWEKENGISLVVKKMEILESNDDIFVNEINLGKDLVERWPDEFENESYAFLYINEAIATGSVMKIQACEKTLLCLPKCYEWYADSRLPASNDFSAEEKHVVDLLRDNYGWMKRTEVILSLKSNFESMATPTVRFNMFMDAKEKKLFYVAKGSRFHIVGLTYKEAFSALKIAEVNIKTGGPSQDTVDENSMSSY